MLIAQISDLHVAGEGRLVYDRVDTGACLREAVAHLMAARPLPDIVVATGDLTDAGRPAEYGALRRILATLPMPVYVLPGNHDRRAALRAAYADQGYLPGEGFLNYAIEGYPLRLVALDTLDEGRDGGLLCGERLAWLDQTLSQAPERPTVILLHHPPFRTGIVQSDLLDLVGAAELRRLVSRHGQVERLLAGHVHRSIHVRFAGTVASTAPSTAHQIPLDLTPDGPPVFVMEPAGYQLHLWDGAGLVSHTATIGAYDGPFPYAAVCGGGSSDAAAEAGK